MNDLVLKGGRVVDPAQGLDKVTDIAFAGGKVAAIGDDLSGKDVRDVAGKIVSPGLIDLHTHVYWGGTSLGVEAELLARTGGVTTFVDAGSAGPGNFHGFRKHVIEPSPVRILPYLNVAFPGIFAFSKTVMVGENADMRLIDPREAVRVAREHKDLVLGIKVRVGRSASGDSGVKPLDIALDVAEEVGLPVMAHLDAPPPSRREVVDRLRPGDILTHCFRPFPNAPVRPDGKVREEILAARARGVIFDIGHGGGSFGFGTTRGMLAAGLPARRHLLRRARDLDRGAGLRPADHHVQVPVPGRRPADGDQARDAERRRGHQAARPRHPEGGRHRRGHGDRASERQVRLCRFDRRAHDGRQAAALGRRGAGGSLVASGVIDEPEDQPKQPSSPACLAHEADDAYMGFATKAEIAAFLAALTAAERAGRPHAEMLRQMLPKIRDDDLHRELTAKLKAQESAESGT